MDADEPRVFVYGTLRQGFTNPGREILDEHARLLAEATVQGQLHDLGAYPGLVRPAEDPSPVHGEVYALVTDSDRAMQRLDRYEGARGPDPLPYERREVEADLADGTTIDVWTYVWTEDPPPGSRVPSGDWVEHVTDR